MRELPIRGRDAGAQLARGVIASARIAGLDLTVEQLHARPWASATFVGTQVSAVLAAPRAPALGRWLGDLPLAEVPMRGHVLASLAVDLIEDNGEAVRAHLTALVIAEG